MPAETAQLREHLAAMYQVRVTGLTELDTGVYRAFCQRRNDLVVRWHPPHRSFDAVAGDADVLDAVEDIGFPAERCARPEPLLEVEDRPVLVTEWIDTVPRLDRREAIRAAGGLKTLGSLLGRLQSLPSSSELARPGGAWHHVAEGGPGAEIAAAVAMVSDDGVRDRLLALDDGAGLPEAFVHPDFVMANVVASPEGMVIVDWSGAGWAPRVWPLAFFLYSEGMKDPRRIARIAAGYREHITLTSAELDRLPAIMLARPAVLTAWLLREGRLTPSQAMTRLDEFETGIRALAGRVGEDFGA